MTKDLIPGILAAAGSASALLQPIGTDTDATVQWIFRGIIALGLGAIAWIVRDAAKTLRDTQTEIRETREDMQGISATVASHQVMFEHWLDDLVNGDIDPSNNPGRRKSDQIIQEILKRSQARKQ